MTSCLPWRCSFVLALAGVAFAQGVKPPGGGGGGGSAGTRGNPTQPPPGTFPRTTPPPDFSQHPLYLSGKVVMEDGGAPADAASIQLVCRANPHTIGRTDGKGGFSIDLNNRIGMATFADASEDPLPGRDPGTGGPGSEAVMSAGKLGSANSSFGSRDLMGCTLQAALAGFRSDVLHLDNRRSMDDPNVGTIILHRVASVEGTTISATSGLAPKDAKKAMERGQNDLKKDKWDDAQKEFQKAVGIYPKYAIAWVELGRTQEHRNDFDDARQSYAKALEADSKLVTPYLALAGMAMREQKWQEVSEQTDRILRLNPIDFPQAYLFNAVSNYYLNNLDAAEKSGREGLNHDAEHRFLRLHELLARVLAQKQDYAGAAVELREYLKYVPSGPEAERAKKQLGDIEKKLEAAKQ